MLTNRSETTAAVSSFATFGDDRGGRIEKVLALSGDADSALAALLGNLDTIIATPGVTIATNQREALFDLRKAAYGY